MLYRVNTGSFVVCEAERFISYYLYALFKTHLANIKLFNHVALSNKRNQRHSHDISKMIKSILPLVQSLMK